MQPFQAQNAATMQEILRAVNSMVQVLQGLTAVQNTAVAPQPQYDVVTAIPQNVVSPGRDDTVQTNNISTQENDMIDDILLNATASLFDEF